MVGTWKSRTKLTQRLFFLSISQDVTHITDIIKLNKRFNNKNRAKQNKHFRLSFFFRIFVSLFLSLRVLRIELDCFMIYKLLNVLFCQRRLLEIEIERPHTHRFFVYIVQRRQIRVAQRLINYTIKKLV